MIAQESGARRPVFVRVCETAQYRNSIISSIKRVVAACKDNAKDLQGEKAAFLNNAVGFLMEKRNFSLEELNYSKFRLRAALESRIQAAKAQAMQTIYYSFLLSDEKFLSDGCCPLIFRLGHYACNYYYQGYRELQSISFLSSAIFALKVRSLSAQR